MSKWGTFIGLKREDNVITGANQVQMTLEKYMELKGITDLKDVVGPFENVTLKEDHRLSQKQIHENSLKLARETQSMYLNNAWLRNKRFFPERMKGVTKRWQQLEDSKD